MNSKVIVSLLLCGLLSAVDSTFIIATGTTVATGFATSIAALGIGALAVAKGALLGSLLARGKRDVSGPEQDQALEIALDVAQQIDSAGCVPKLLCELEAIPESHLSSALRTLKNAFGNPNKAGGLYGLAINFGAKLARNDPKACDRFFDKCPLQREQLFDMAESTFAC